MLRVKQLRSGPHACDLPIHLHATQGDVTRIKDALARGPADLGSRRDFRSWTPLLISAYYGRLEVGGQRRQAETTAATCKQQAAAHQLAGLPDRC